LKEFIFADQDIAVVQAYAKACGKIPGARFVPGNIFDYGPGVLVVPINGQGDLDQGLALQCAQRFREEGGLESFLKAIIRHDRGGELEPGKVQILSTHDEQFPYILFLSIVDENMLVPGGNVVAKAVTEMFRFIPEWNEFRRDLYIIERLIVPGLGAGLLGLTPEKSAKGFYEGYRQGHAAAGA
jgi:O-acetyl-ADP-ribose deacetylase (regulator of RNase III)